jgi:prevent-host-death family protein
MMTIKEVMMINKEVSVAEAKKHLSELLGRVAYGGERIMISKRGKPMAVLIPPGEEASAEEHLSKVEGWLEPGDPFFDTIDQIVHDRASHLPRISKDSKG